MTLFVAAVLIVAVLIFWYAKEIIIKWDSDEKKVMMWEILVPASGKEQEFAFEHHKEWDKYVRNMAGGLTILKTAKGEWVSPDGTLFRDRVIPVRINCTKKQIKKNHQIYNRTLQPRGCSCV